MPIKSRSRQIIVLFLVVNRIPYLPMIAIKSVLDNSNCKIVVGYLSKNDLSEIPDSPRVSYFDLSKAASSLGLNVGNGKYENFDQDSFFSLVQLKWNLILDTMKLYKDADLIYNDIDVFWLRPVSEEIQNIFKKSKRCNLIIQSSTSNPSDPQLCMGFLGIRNNSESKKLIANLSRLHRNMLKTNKRAGDDDVITAFYNSAHQPNYILQLPQSTFPVGNLLNNFSKKKLYPGLIPFKPYIYHANFVVGASKKLQITYLIHKNLNMKIHGLSKLTLSKIIFEIKLRKTLQFLGLKTIYRFLAFLKRD